jgi:hypothetical protein
MDLKKTAGLIFIIILLLINFNHYSKKTNLPIASYDSTRYYYYNEKIISTGEYSFYDDLSYGGRFNASPPLQEMIIFSLYNLFGLNLSVYDFLKYYAFIIFSSSAIFLYLYLYEKKGLFSGIFASLFFIFNIKLNYSFEAGVIKHFQLGVLMLILGFFIIEKFSKSKWALLVYSIILPLSYLESIMIFGIMLAYMIFCKKSNKKYLLIGFFIGCLFWLWVLIMSGSTVLTSEYVYEKISENRPLEVNTIYDIMGYSLLILLVVFFKFLKKHGFEEIFFILLIIIYSFGRVKDIIFLIIFIIILMGYLMQYLFSKSKALALIVFIAASLLYAPIFYEHIEIVSWQRPSASLIEAYSWINNNTPLDSVIFDCINHGPDVIAYSNRKNVGDNFFEFIGDEPLNASIDYIDFIAGYSSSYSKSIIEKYDADYVVFHKLMNDSCYWWVNPVDKLIIDYFDNKSKAPFIYYLKNGNVDFLDNVFENKEYIIYEFTE